VSADFEIRARLRAERLTVHVPPHEGATTRESTTITRRELRHGLPPRLRRSGRYADIVVDKEVQGSLVEP
jgi:hypothetical protein